MFRASEATAQVLKNKEKFATEFFKNNRYNPFKNDVVKAVQDAVKNYKLSTECKIVKPSEMTDIQYRQYREELVTALSGFGYEASCIECTSYHKILIDWYADE